jgi:hypothetical protein
MTHYRDIFEKYLPGDKSYQCALWAFGKGFEYVELGDLMDRWNDLHKDIFELFGNGAIEIDIPRIIEAWKEKGVRTTPTPPKQNNDK